MGAIRKLVATRRVSVVVVASRAVSPFDEAGSRGISAAPSVDARIAVPTGPLKGKRALTASRGNVALVASFSSPLAVGPRAGPSAVSLETANDGGAGRRTGKVMPAVLMAAVGASGAVAVTARRPLSWPRDGVRRRIRSAVALPS